MLSLLLLTAALGPLQDDGSQKWEKAISKFEESDKLESPPKGATLFIGSSSIRMWKLDESFPDLAVINRGFGGSQVSDSIAFVNRIVHLYEPKLVVMYAGDNDVARGKTPDVVTRDFKKFAALIHAKLPNTHVFYIAIKPSISRWKLYPKMAEANNQIKVIADKDDKLTYVDIATPMLDANGGPGKDQFLKDGLHMNKKGYDVWTRVLRPLLDKHEARRK